MYRKRRISVCVPARNEGNHLKQVIDKIPAFVDEIIIVSNCSTDNTVKVAKKLGLEVWEDNRTKNNIGYGFAHMTAIDKSKGDLIVGMDADGTYPIEDLAAVIDFMDKNDLDFVSCNRYPVAEKTAKIPLKIHLGTLLLNGEARLLYGQAIKDTLSGMWVFKASVKPYLNLTEGDWNLTIQIKLNAARDKRIRFGEYSIVQHRRQGESHMQYFRTGLSFAGWMLKNRLRKSPS